VSLRQIIVKEIRDRGPIPFSRYMELCLYHPQLGYYSRNTEQFGKAGDFYTSSDVHAVFGRLLARQFEETWRMMGSPAQMEVLELGPGRGLFAQDVLDWSEKKFPDFSRALHYSLSEQSPALRAKLGETLTRFLQNGRASVLPQRDSEIKAEGAARDVTGEDISGKDVTGKDGKGTTLVVPKAVPSERALAPEAALLVFANEFFDALPVEIVSEQGTLRVSTRENRFTETWAPPSTDEIDFLDRYSVNPEPGERIEIPLLAHQYMSSLAESIPTGMIIAIDYGYTRREQLAGRHRGTLMAYRQHSASPNPYQAPGEQDLTAHANFTALAAAAEGRGMQTQPLLTQSQFLMGIGEPNQFADVFEECRLPQERAKAALQLKHLVTPAGMGETFQVMVATRNVDAERVAGLSGLSYSRGRLNPA
jgi:SAM-dependent MidA family methyltransferase